MMLGLLVANFFDLEYVLYQGHCASLLPQGMAVLPVAACGGAFGHYLLLRCHARRRRSR